MNAYDDYLIWVDLEMTGLDPDNNRIIEIATLVTDNSLNVIAEGPAYAIYQEESVLALMDKWNVRQHTSSGLIARVKESKISEVEAEQMTLEFLRQHITENKSPMCGSSICQDRRFLYRWMPELERYFHYRNLDVSTLKELCKRWNPDVAKGFKKDSKHIAMADIYDSIEELKYYRAQLFKEST